MYKATLLTLPLLFGALVALPERAPAQVGINVQFGTALGPEIGVFAYSPERYGPWASSYQNWTPVTLYDINGRYYRRSVRGARPVQMYTYKNEYFLPPQDQAWARRDPRYNYEQQPGESDYGRARPYTPDAAAFDQRRGAEVGVLAYSAERAGDWRNKRNVRRWTPVTLYEVNGRYYPKNGPGTRAVSMYRYQNEYFLPPTDQGWVGSDRRFTQRNLPNDDDHRRARPNP